jgi:hypothetical protein
VIAVDRDPGAPGSARRPRAIISTEDEPGSSGSRRPERVDGVIAPGIDWPVAIAARIARRLALPHPLTPEVARSRRRSFAARAARRGRRAAAADGSRALDEARAAVELIGSPASSRRPTGRGSEGSRSSATSASCRRVDAALEALALDALPRRGARRRPEVTVNAFSLDGASTRSR